MDNGPVFVDTTRSFMVEHRTVACGVPTEVLSHVEVSELFGLAIASYVFQGQECNV